MNEEWVEERDPRISIRYDNTLLGKTNALVSFFLTTTEIYVAIWY